MAYKKTDKLIKYNNDYNREQYDRIALMVKKGRKAELQAYAASKNESLNAFINRAIDEAISREFSSDK